MIFVSCHVSCLIHDQRYSVYRHKGAKKSENISIYFFWKWRRNSSTCWNLEPVSRNFPSIVQRWINVGVFNIKRTQNETSGGRNLDFGKYLSTFLWHLWPKQPNNSSLLKKSDSPPDSFQGIVENTFINQPERLKCLKVGPTFQNLRTLNLLWDWQIFTSEKQVTQRCPDYWFTASSIMIQHTEILKQQQHGEFCSLFPVISSTSVSKYRK